eukprot:Gregarina_sp_Pseudo_9__3321@NODE_349_length_3088_cov_8_800262_g328_i0_p1_GENE_NODE_349_length_3088_cov_8_800262_g328_i0NODE_349_length_3088_cov_8_800262_g328_i0_p1_ORF_typecomplete_len555_score133_20EPL1/PF10513_9/0_00091MIS13/PF08202_11/0_3MIS13/PF08202_11/1_1e03HTH_IclR/PF09339_10/0_32VSNARE_C/PF12352_8/5_4e03VSNARE_C/PF12352_8/0_17_NODE_349_length_3088_cov_8_800262_g328_i012622926
MVLEKADVPNSQSTSSKKTRAVVATDAGCPPPEPPISIVTSLKELEKLLLSLNVHSQARDEALTAFRARLQSDKAALKAVAQFGDVPASHIKKSHKVIKTPGARLLTEEELSSLGPRTPYTCPAHYVKHCVHKDYVQPLRLGNGDTVSYDLSYEDLTFLDNLAKVLSQNESFNTQNLEESFMRLIDQFEHNSGLGHPISVDVAMGIAQSLQASTDNLPLWAVRNIHQHWVERRGVLQKPLLRCYWSTPPQNVPAQYHVFRMKVSNRERMSLRRPRRSIQDAAQKMDFVLADLKRAEKILKQMIRRDRQKLLISELNTCIFDQMRHEILDPTYVNPHWTYLKRAKFASLFAKGASAQSQEEAIDKWLDSLADLPPSTEVSLPKRKPFSEQELSPDIAPCAIEWGGGKSVPGGASLDLPLPSLSTRSVCSLRTDSGNCTWVDCVPVHDYCDDSAEMILPAELGASTSATSPRAEKRVDKFAIVHNRTVDPVPLCATLEYQLSSEAHTLHQLKQLRLLRALARSTQPWSAKTVASLSGSDVHAPSSFKMAGLTGGVK